ncbi:hypothetical protein [Alkalicoccobacillus porphyridii]|uniref:HIG1 domain-containing protein n=1 Tax=Alkalicoccobacillus porphyridii TaxID=2597270 RepID=A0A553ZVC5_9BACI|nr:hypothetical protein [Alkalicoccobacillus porphyridii]TSB45419.1 hypothetical protein FN960_15900 [Alkalicoccobacillus porphyridii]
MVELLISVFALFFILLAFNAFGYFGFLRGEKGVSSTRWFTLTVLQTVVIIGISSVFRVI